MKYIDQEVISFTKEELVLLKHIARNAEVNILSREDRDALDRKALKFIGKLLAE